MDTESDFVPGLREKLALFFRKPEIRLVVLYGSRAAGRTHPKSDIDLGVMADEPLDTVATTVELGRFLSANDVDLVDLRRASPLLARRIVDTAIVLYERENGLYARFVSLAVRRYIDTAKLRKARQKVIGQFLDTRGPR